MNKVFDYLLNWDKDAFECPPDLKPLNRGMVNTEETQVGVPL